MAVRVVDASVVLKWIVPEVGSHAARALLDGQHEFVAPDLLCLEIASAIWTRVRRKEFTLKQGRELVADFADIAVDTISVRDLGDDAFELATATGITVYDAAYVAVAVRLDAPFITADRRLADTLAAHPSLAAFISPLM